MSHDDKNSAGSGSYVLNAMDAKEREEFEVQLTESEELRNEVTEMTDTAVLLGMAVAPVTPPPALKQNIMARLSQTPQLPREDATDAFAPVRMLHAVPPLEVEDSPEERPSRVTMAPAAAKAQARWYTRPVVVLTSAAAAVVLIAGVVFGSSAVLQNAHSTSQAQALASISSASDVQRAAAAVSTGGTATLIWSDKLARSALIGKGLAALPSGKTYELWYIDGAGKASGAGLFESDGSSTVAVLSGQMVPGDTIGVTVEPAGGSSSPTTTPIVAIKSA